jgi:ribosomal protein S18 acetylase RimI-like enzyme
MSTPAFTIRHLETSDQTPILQVVDLWWGGRPMAALLPRLFFEHFHPTSFVLEEAEAMRGFLIGFRSQTSPTTAYIHFVGVDPTRRSQGLGRMLYQHFFEVVHQSGCTEVHAITSPVNKGSIAFHKSMGFEILPGDAKVDGIAVTRNYDGNEGERVRFRHILYS